MNKSILKKEIQTFINGNLQIDVPSLLLKKPCFEEVSNKELAQQIVSKNKARTKLPTWFRTPGIYYPHKLNLEQASSEITAKYKAKIVHGDFLIDLTGGFGVDSFHFVQKIGQVYHCELNNELSKIATHNFKVFEIENVSPLNTDGLEYLKKSDIHFDWIYLDPSRRSLTREKVFRLADCAPDVSQYLKLLFSKSPRILIKTSPLLDISAGKRDLPHVKEIHVVAVKNEVKELLWVLQKGHDEDTKVLTVNMHPSRITHFSFMMEEAKNEIPSFSQPLRYLYEPNAAILKSGAFLLVGNRYGVHKLHMNTHLYTSDELREFPGRRFKIEKDFPYTKSLIKELKLKKANIATRNFPGTVASLRKRLKLLDGGEDYLFFVTDKRGGKRILLCSKR